MSHPIHFILSAGTRIVTRNDANRIGGGLPDGEHETMIRYMAKEVLAEL